MTLLPRSLRTRTVLLVALAFILFLTFFFLSSFFSIRDSLLRRTDNEVTIQLRKVVAGLRPAMTEAEMAAIVAAHNSIGESRLSITIFEKQGDSIVQCFPKLRAELETRRITPLPSSERSLSVSAGSDSRRTLTLESGNVVVTAVYDTIAIDEAEDSIVQVFAYYLLAGLVIAALVGVLISRILARPIGVLAASAREIVRRPEPDHARLPVSARISEVAELATAINNLLDARERSVEHMRNFAADAAHELRTPLSVLKGEIEVELRILPEGDERGELLRSNLEEIDRLIAIVQDLLELAEIEQEEPDAVNSVCSLRSAVEYAAGRLMPLANDRGIHIQTLKQDVLVAASEERMTRLVYNLLLNAVQHSRTAREITVRLVLSDTHCTLEVEDHGVGIPRDRLAHLFDRFFRASPGASSQRRGAGLGLAIAKSIADRYGFRLSVRSEEGSGTTVSVSIPATSVIG